MIYSTEPKFRKYVEEYGFGRKFSDKCNKKLMDTATKAVIDAAKLLLKE